MDKKSSEKSELDQGMELYDYIVNHVDTVDEQMPELIEKLFVVDDTGQFLASSARYLAAIDKKRFSPFIGKLVEGAILKDRERRYISSLLEALWGKDYKERAAELQVSDENFRRIYKRIYPAFNLTGYEETGCRE